MGENLPRSQYQVVLDSNNQNGTISLNNNSNNNNKDNCIIDNFCRSKNVNPIHNNQLCNSEKDDMNNYSTKEEKIEDIEDITKRDDNITISEDNNDNLGNKCYSCQIHNDNAEEREIQIVHTSSIDLNKPISHNNNINVKSILKKKKEDHHLDCNTTPRKKVVFSKEVDEMLKSSHKKKKNKKKNFKLLPDEFNESIHKDFEKQDVPTQSISDLKFSIFCVICKKVQSANLKSYCEYTGFCNFEFDVPITNIMKYLAINEAKCKDCDKVHNIHWVYNCLVCETEYPARINVHNIICKI